MGWWEAMRSEGFFMPEVEEVIRRGREHGLVPVGEVLVGVRWDLRYAGAGNFAGEALYPWGMPCLLAAGTAERLAVAREELLGKGCDLLIWDGWRPAEAAERLWDLVRDPRYAAEPGAGGRWSWHCYGRAVDVTLTDLEGRELEMPSDLDDFGVAGAAEYAGGEEGTAARLGWLQAAMTGAGFRMLASEWWHFSDPVAAVPERPVRAADCGMVIPVFSAGSRASGGVDQ